jgi:hypothetical protein
MKVIFEALISEKRQNSWLFWQLILASVMLGSSSAIAQAAEPLDVPSSSLVSDERSTSVVSPVPVLEGNLEGNVDIPFTSPATQTEQSISPGMGGNMAQVLPVAQFSDHDSATLAVKKSGSGNMSQVTSVSQLSDIQPTDWAFQALQSLVERYGCIAGYPDGTYRGNRPLSRYEFAAGLNACMDRISELISSATADLVTKADLETVKKLQEEFAVELATLKGRVDAIEANTATLEAQKFSTTTKLSGLVFFNLTGATADGRVKVETSDASAPLEIRPAGRDPVTNKPLVQKVGDPQIAYSALAWLTLNTSFTGKDQLVTQLVAGNGNSPANFFASSGLYNTFGVPYTDQTAADTVGTASFAIRDFFYQFPVTKSLQIVVGPRVNWYRYFDNNRYTFFLNGASSFNSIGSTLTNTIDRGSGAVVLWDINKYLKIHVAYLGESDEFLPSSLFNSSSNPSQGLFGGTNTTTVEVSVAPTKTINLRFLYNRSNIQQIFGQIGGPAAEPLQGGIADDGFGGPLGNATADTFGFNFDWAITPKFGIFGRYGYGSVHLFPKTPGIPDGDVNVQSLQAGIAFPDLGKKGAQLTLSYLIPYAFLDGRKYLVSGGGNGGVQYEFEATYFFPVTDNIAVVPAFYFIGNPNNFSNNPNIYVGNLRTQFSF